MNLNLAGHFAPLVTPFTDGGETVSEVRLARLVRHLKRNGIAGFVVCSNTGEFTTVTTSERKTVLEIVLRESGGLPVLAHCTRIGTLQTLDLVRHAAEKGARAAVVMPPYFGMYSDEEIEGHIRSIVAHAGLPIILLDPQHCVRANARERLSNLPNLCYAEGMEQTFHARYGVYPAGPGSDEFVVDNAIVSPMIQLVPSACNSDADLKPLSNLLARHGRARVGKAALNEMEVEVGPPRPPALPLGPEHRLELVSVLRAYL